MTFWLDTCREDDYDYDYYYNEEYDYKKDNYDNDEEEEDKTGIVNETTCRKTSDQVLSFPNCNVVHEMALLDSNPKYLAYVRIVAGNVGSLAYDSYI